ncbi:hypothetical protein ACFLU9_00255 [Chloroflexota bacterium]
MGNGKLPFFTTFSGISLPVLSPSIPFLKIGKKRVFLKENYGHAIIAAMRTLLLLLAVSVVMLSACAAPSLLPEPTETAPPTTELTPASPETTSPSSDATPEEATTPSPITHLKAFERQRTSGPGGGVIRGALAVLLVRQRKTM